MRTIIVILLLALISVSSLAKHNVGRNKRHHFRPTDEYNDDPYNDSNGNDPYNQEQPENEENEENEEEEEEEAPKKHHGQHQHKASDPNQDSNNETPNVQPSGGDDSNNNDSNNNDANSNNSNPSNNQDSTPSGSLNSDTLASTDYNGDAKFKQQCLDIHNDQRAALGIGPVTYNDDLAAAAKVWAEQLAINGALSHSKNRHNVGENVSFRTHHDDQDSTPPLIQGWIDEKQYFFNGDYPDISTTGNTHDVGHYSQMIWAGTKEIGCAVVQGAENDYMCCQYSPAGNVIGRPVY